MNDTSPEIQKLVFQKIMERSGEERFIMGALMFDAAREIILASFPKDLPEAELKSKIIRTYLWRTSGICDWKSLTQVLKSDTFVSL